MPSSIPRIIACADANDIEGVKKCINDGCNIDEQRQDGRSALLVACLKGYFDIVKVLVDNHANVLLKNNKGGNALGHAAYKNHANIVQFLLDNDANPNDKDKTGRNTLHIACFQGCDDVVQVLVNSGKLEDIDARTQDNRDVLSLAVSGGCSVRTIAELVLHGASLNVVDELKHNLLHQSVLKGDLQLLDFFYLHSNINLNLIDSIGNTCVHLACRIGNRSILTYLFYHGAMINCRNKEGKFPDVVAVDNDHQDIADFLHQVLSPPPPIKSAHFYKTKRSSEVEVEWEYATQPNYYPSVDAIEIQIKQNKFFDSWKTVATFKGSDRESTPEDQDRMKMSVIQFDRKCSVKVDKSLDAFFEEHTKQLEQRTLPPKQHVSPQSHTVLTDLSAGQPYVLRSRCASKYGWGPYSASFAVEPVSRGKTSKPDVEFQKLSSSSESSESSDEGSSDESSSEEEQPKAQDDTALIQELLSGGVEKLMQAVAKGVILCGLRTGNGMNLLHVAAGNGQNDAVRLLVEQGGLNVNVQSSQQTTALHHAVYGDHLDTVQLLVTLGGDITVKDVAGLSPFLLACSRGNLSITEFLMKHVSSDIKNQTDSNGRNALMLAIANSQLSVASFLIEHGFDSTVTLSSRGWNLLFFAIGTKKKEVVQYCLDLGLSPCFRAMDGSTPADFSLNNGTPEITKLLNSYAVFPAVITSIEGQVKGSSIQITVQLPPLSLPHPLLDYRMLEVSYKKASFLATSTVETVSLEEYFKSHSPSDPVFVMLDDLNEGATYQCKARLTNKNGCGQWSKNLELKIEEKEEEDEDDDDDEEIEIDKSKGLLKVLTPRLHEKPKSESSESDESDESVEDPKPMQPEKPSPLPQGIVVESQTPQTPSSLQSTPMEVKSIEPAPLQQASTEITDAMILQFLQNGDVKALQSLPPSRLINWISPDGLPALHTCILQCQELHLLKLVLKYLTDIGCNLQQEVTCGEMKAVSPILCACLIVDSTALKFLLSKKVALPTQWVAGIPIPLFFSLLAPSSACLLELLKNGFNVRMTGALGRSLLQILVCTRKYRHFEDIALQLLNKGVNIDAQDQDGNTALHLAVMYRNPSMIAFLVMHGASLTLTNAKGQTPDQIASTLHDTESLQALQAVMEKPFPPSAPQVYVNSENWLLIRWTHPLYRYGVPEPTLYEIEGIKENGEIVTICEGETGNSWTGPNPLGSLFSIRIRAKNCNGWSAWSERGLGLNCGNQESMNDDLYLWLFQHSIEQYYSCLKSLGVTSIPELLLLTNADIAKLNLKPLHERILLEALTRVRQSVIRIQTNGKDESEKTKESRLAWFRK